MLVSAAADIGFVLHRALVWTACACSLPVVASFGLFVHGGGLGFLARYSRGRA